MRGCKRPFERPHSKVSYHRDALVKSGKSIIYCSLSASNNAFSRHEQLFHGCMVHLHSYVFQDGGYIPLLKRIITPILFCADARHGGVLVIVYEKLWVTMEEKGVSTYQLRERCGIDSKTIRRLRANENMETKTLDKLCTALSCRLEDIAEYREGG